MMRFTIHKTGLLATVQDLGREAYLAQAVPHSGTMDTLSARIANIALGNKQTDAVIEFTYAGASLHADTDMLIAYAGDGALLYADQQLIKPERPVFIPAGTVLHLKTGLAGCRTYLAIAGGVDVPEVLQSRSTYLPAALGGLDGRALKPDDVMMGNPGISSVTQKIFDQLKGGKISTTRWSLPRKKILPVDDGTICLVRGPEYGWFKQADADMLWASPFRLGQRSDRMGYHLEGAAISRETDRELLSTCVVPGTIQVTGNGGMIMLMADCQTTGGYPRIAQVAAVHLPLCAQLKPGDQLRFSEITWELAMEMYIKSEQEIDDLAKAVANQYL
ncbi:5-oxoprolinase subunit C family protein [Mucilaginibacter mali]|nr:biotin-dependent carboxyltransferase family protein [Mucilaginibacter mali]